VIPDKIKVGGMVYSVQLTDETLLIDNRACKGLIEYDSQVIKINTTMHGIQSQEQTFCHELIHAMVRERNIDWGENNEEYTEELAKVMYQVLKDNNIDFTALTSPIAGTARPGEKPIQFKL